MSDTAHNETKSDEQPLRKTVRRIVEIAEPERIILFGSVARGQADRNSDLDLLVIKGGQFDRDALIKDIYANLGGVGAAVDVVLVTPEEVQRYRDTHCLVIKPALRDGREAYRA